MRAELSRFRVRAGAEERVDEWMRFLNDNLEAVKETLEPEQMYVETIFSEQIEGVTYLTWYTLRGEDGLPVEHSEHWLDKRHLEFWQECIDESPAQRPHAVARFIPDRVTAAMRPKALE